MPLDYEEVKKRFEEKGLKLLTKEYKNNEDNALVLEVDESEKIYGDITIDKILNQQ